MHPFDISFLQSTCLRIKQSKYESSKSIRQQCETCKSNWKQPLDIPITEMTIVTMLFTRKCRRQEWPRQRTPGVCKWRRCLPQWALGTMEQRYMQVLGPPSYR